MFTFDLVQSGLIFVLLLAVGEKFSRKLHSALPSALVSAVLFIALIWIGVIPSTIIDNAGLTVLTQAAVMFIIIGLGASTNIRELADNWKVVTLAALTYLGQVILLLLTISLLFGRNMAIGALPGGSVVAYIVQERARALGYDHIVVLSVLLFTIQGLISCPLVSWMVRKEILRIQKEEPQTAPLSCHSDQPVTGQMPAASSPYWSLLRLYFAAWISSRLEMYTGISQYVYALLIGVLLGHIGLLKKDEMERSKSQGFCNLMLMAMVLNGFSKATPGMFADLMSPLLIILAADVLCIFILSVLLGKFFGFSRYMRFAIGLNVMMGFPLNMMIAQDLIESLARTQEEKSVFHQQISTRLIIAGFTSVTCLAPIGAGLLVTFMV